MAERLELLPLEALVKTSEVDHADWNYKPVLSWIQRTRFRQIVKLLDGQQYERLLEIGYGSGVLMPMLKQHCADLHGLDPHDKHEEVKAALAGHGIDATLYSCSVSEIPVEDNMFDCAVAVSALEYVDDIDKACEEMKRVLRPGGTLILVTPGKSLLLDFGLKILTGESAEGNYGRRRDALQPALLRHFQLDRRIQFPAIGGQLVRLYTSLKLLSPG